MKNFNKLMFLSIVMIGGASSMLSAYGKYPATTNQSHPESDSKYQYIHIANSMTSTIALESADNHAFHEATSVYIPFNTKKNIAFDKSNKLYYRFVSSHNEPFMVENVTHRANGAFQFKDITGDTINIK